MSNPAQTIKKLFDPAEVQHALSILVEQGQVFEVRVLKASTQAGSRYTDTLGGYFDNPNDVIKHIARIRSALGMYITLQTCHPELLGRASNKLIKQDKDYSTPDKYITGYRWLLIDSDPERVSLISSTDEAHEKALAHSRHIQDELRLQGWPEPIVADSGNGGHLLYRIDLTATDSDLVKRTLEGLALKFDIPGLHVDKGVFNPARISKLYGTLACKGDDTPRWPHRMARILSVPETIKVISREQLATIAVPTPADPGPQKQTSHQASNASPSKTFDVQDFMSQHSIEHYGPEPYEGGTRYILKKCCWDTSHTDRSAVIIQHPSGAISASCRHDSCIGKKWQDLRTIYEPGAYDRQQQYQSYQAKASETSSNGHQAEEQKALPQIYIDGQLHEYVDPALKAIENAEKANPHGPTIFVQSARLVLVCRDEKHRPRIVPMGIAELKDILDRSAQFFKPHRRTKEGVDYIDCAPTKEIAEQILAKTPDKWYFPPLEAIIEVPILRPDGTILSSAGYDPTTCLYYMPQAGLVISPIPEHPTQDDVTQASAYLHGFIGDFPYASQADYANAYGTMFTPILRHIVRHVPLGLVDATKQGTGKGLLTDYYATIATGHIAASLAQISSEEEWEKRITSLLMGGATFIAIDNVEGVLRSAILSKILTSETHKGRMLGFSQMVDVSQRATWIANGNNIQLGGDMPRRCYRIHMATLTSEPWKRAATEFTYPDLIEAAREHRGEIIAALLILARAWFDAGKPAPRQKLEQLGTFSAWVHTVGGILSFAGINGFLTNLDELHRTADVDGVAWAAFLALWKGKLGEGADLTRDLIAKWQNDPDILDVMPEPLSSWFHDSRTASSKPPPSSRKVGKLLAKKNGTPYGPDNLCIIQGEDGHTKQATFCVGTPKNAGYAVFAGFDLFLREEKTLTQEENMYSKEEANQTPQIPHTPQNSEIHSPESVVNVKTPDASIPRSPDIEEQVRQVKQKIASLAKVHWSARQSGFESALVAPAEYLIRLRTCLESGDPDRIRSAQDEIAYRMEL